MYVKSLSHSKYSTKSCSNYCYYCYCQIEEGFKFGIQLVKFGIDLEFDPIRLNPN